MTNMNIKLYRDNTLTKKCVLCEREVHSNFQHIDIEWEDNEGSYGRYRNLCGDCHCALKKIFTGIH